jgi:hypothetical protein
MAVRFDSPSHRGGVFVMSATDIVRGSNGGAGAVRAAREATAFRSAPRLLPDDLAQYVANKPRAQDDQYDSVLGYAFSLMSGWAYANHQTIAKQIAYEGLDANVILIECTNDAMLVVATAYFIRSKCGRLGVLSFRGTEPTNLISWMTDANSVLRPFVYGHVHAGFYANVQVVWDDINGVLRSALANASAPRGLAVLPSAEPAYDRPMDSLYITGHSLGAAMAVVAAACLLQEPNDGRGWDSILRGIYTYGQPMVGDAEFVANCKKRFQNRLFRHVYGDDLVARMPPKTIHNFKHFGQRRYSAAPDQPWEASKPSARDESPSLVDTLGTAAMSFVVRRLSLPRIVDLVPLPYSIDDHMPTNYIHASRSTLVV